MIGSASQSCKINGKDVELNSDGNFSTIVPLKLGDNKIKVEIDGEVEERKVIGIKAKSTKPVSYGEHYEAFPPDKPDKRNVLRSIVVSDNQIKIPLNVPPIYQLEKHGSHKLVMDLADIEMDLDWIHYKDPNCKIIIGEVLESKFPIIFKQPIDNFEEKWEDDNLILDITYKEVDFAICLDPGHGGKSSGTVSPKGVLEKDLNLEVSNKIKTELENLGVKVFMTREDDRFVSLEGRVHFAKDNDCNLILSVHHNALPDARDPREERGVSCHYFHEQSKPFAVNLLNKLSEFSGLPCAGLFKQNLHILRETPDATAVLVELGYLIHPEESEVITADEYQSKVSKIIAKAIYNFFVKPSEEIAQSNGAPGK